MSGTYSSPIVIIDDGDVCSVPGSPLKVLRSTRHR